MKRAVLVLTMLTGCAGGGGPLVGVGFKRGPFVGAEVVGGWAFAQAALAYQSDRHIVYWRADAAVDLAGVGNGRNNGVFDRFMPGGRLGAGHVITGPGAGVFAGGINAGTVLSEPSSCHGTFPAAVVGLDLRYVAGDWQLVLSPRIEAKTGMCVH